MAEQHASSLRNTVLKLVVVAIAMFAFALWVMPPLYTLFCEITGLNGKTGGPYQAVSAEVDTSRTVTVRFIGINNSDMPWKFKPADFSLKVHPGEAVVTHFLARNPTEQIMVGQAVPSLVPYNAASFFHKTECFCFNQQALGPGESAELAVRFIVDQEVPKGVSTITLSYTLFDITKDAAELVVQKAQQIAEQNERPTEDYL